MNLRDMYESLSILGLNEFVNRRQEENLHLEFKRVSSPELSSADDKKNLSRMLSAFANSSGGLIIWGVDARENSDGIDCATSLQEIPRIGVFLTRLNELDGDAVNPIISGVQHRIIVSAPGSDIGCAVTLVPESESGPHMAKFSDDRYYKRSGHRRYRMEHYDIADMFGRRRRPILELTVRPRLNGNQIIVGLRNIGRAGAIAPYLSVSTDPPFRRSPYGINGNHHEGLPHVVADSQLPPWRYSARADEVIHPGVSREVACLTRENNATPVSPEGVVITYAITCEGMQLVEGRHLVPITELR